MRARAQVRTAIHCVRFSIKDNGAISEWFTCNGAVQSNTTLKAGYLSFAAHKQTVRIYYNPSKLLLVVDKIKKIARIRIKTGRISEIQKG